MLFSFKIDHNITGELSTNKFYAGMHWKERKDIADEWHSLTYYTLRQHRIITDPVDVPVEIVIKSDDKLDADNHFVIIKMIIDGMVEYGILEDDTRKYVKKVSFEFYEEEGIKVEIYESNIRV